MKKLLWSIFFACLLIFTSSALALAETTVTVNSTKVNVRSGPATSFDKIATVVKGDIFTVVNEENGWYQILFASEKENTAWIIADYVKKTLNDNIPKSISGNEQNVNVRSGAGTNYTKIGQLVNGQKYAVVGEKEYWYEIRYNLNKHGFVAKWLCLTWDEEITFPEEQEPEVPTINPYNFATALKHGTVNTNSLNLRNAANASAEIISEIPIGTTIAIYERSGDWYHIVEQGGKVGFVYADYVDLNNVEQKLQPGSTVDLPSWDETSATVGTITLAAESYLNGVKLTLSSDIDIIYRIEKIAHGYDFISDMSFSAASGNLNGVAWLLSGNSYNRMSFTGENDVYYRIEQNNFNHQLEIFISSYPVMNKIIYLDAGHSVWNKGVLDPGASGANGTKENVVVFAITKQLQTILESYGATVYLTHEGESTLSRPERCTLANNAGADIFVSVHANASTSSTVRGTTVYTYAPSGNLNYDRNLRLALGKNILDSILTATGLNNLGLREKGFDVLVYTKMPAILIETAFISNPEEEALLADPIWQRLMAESIAKGICNYFYNLEN